MDLIEMYAQGAKINIELGQRCKIFYEERGASHYRNGVVVARYDTHFEIETRNGHSLVRYDNQDEMRQVQLLTIDGKPVIAKRKFFGLGGYKL